MREDWIEVELGELSLLELGGDWGKDPNIENDEYLEAYCIRGSEFRNWENDKGKTASLRKIKKDSIEKRNLLLDDILVEISGGGPEQPVGRTVVIEHSVLNQFKGKNLICTNFLRLIRPSDFVNSIYLNHYLKYFYSTGKIIRYQSGSNNLRNLKFNDYLTIEIPFSPLPIQRAIVSKIEALFSDLDNGIANFKKAQEQLKIYRQAVLEQGLTGVFTKKYREKNPHLENSEILFQRIQHEIDNSFKNACKVAKEKGFNKPKDQRKNTKANNVISNLPNIPWNYYRLEDLTYLVSDGTHFKPKYQEQGVKFLSVKNVRPFLIKDDDVKYISEIDHNKLIERCKPENGDILYTKVGATYGYASQVKLHYEFSIYVSLCLIKPVYKYLTTRFLEYLMNSEIVFRQARQRVSGSGVPDLHLVEIRDFKIPLPSVEEQNQIVQEIEFRLSVCDKMEQSLIESSEKAEALRQSILKKAFEGKLLSNAEIEHCKKAADYEPASVLLNKIKAEKLAKEQEKKKATIKKKSKK